MLCFVSTTAAFVTPLLNSSIAPSLMKAGGACFGRHPSHSRVTARTGTRRSDRLGFIANVAAHVPPPTARIERRNDKRFANAWRTETGDGGYVKPPCSA